MNRLCVTWRNLARALAACLLAVLVLGPALDAVVCEDDSAVAAAHAVGGPKHSHQAPDQHSDRDGLCVHGHCHQASASAPAAPLVAVSSRIEPQVYALAAGSAPPRDRHFELMRPPRA